MIEVIIFIAWLVVVSIAFVVGTGAGYASGRRAVLRRARLTMVDRCDRTLATGYADFQAKSFYQTEVVGTATLRYVADGKIAQCIIQDGNSAPYRYSAGKVGADIQISGEDIDENTCVDITHLTLTAPPPERPI